jgi:signal peptidase I
MTDQANVLVDSSAAKCELAGEVLLSFGTVHFAATGWSMLPTIWSGDTLTVQRVSADQVRVGDVALVGRNGGLCAHRIVGLPDGSENRFWITQGDAMPMADGPVIESELLGRVTQLRRSGKCLAVRAKLNVIERLLARLVRRSVFAARVFVYLTTRVHPRRESIFSCQD